METDTRLPRWEPDHGCSITCSWYHHHRVSAGAEHPFWLPHFRSHASLTVVTKGCSYYRARWEAACEEIYATSFIWDQETRNFLLHVLTVLPETQCAVAIVTSQATQGFLCVDGNVFRKDVVRKQHQFCRFWVYLEGRHERLTEELDLPQAHLDTSRSGKSKMFIGSATS